MGRVLLRVALVLVGLGSAASAWLVVLSLQPKPGARMILMGLPCVALPVAVGAALAVGAAATNESGLNRWERWAVWVAGGLVLAVYGSLLVLG